MVNHHQPSLTAAMFIAITAVPAPLRLLFLFEHRRMASSVRRAFTVRRPGPPFALEPPDDIAYLVTCWYHQTIGGSAIHNYVNINHSYVTTKSQSSIEDQINHHYSMSDSSISMLK